MMVNKSIPANYWHVRTQDDRTPNRWLFQGDRSMTNCDCEEERKIPAPEIWEAIRKAATTAGTLMNLRN